MKIYGFIYFLVFTTLVFLFFTSNLHHFEEKAISISLFKDRKKLYLFDGFNLFKKRLFVVRSNKLGHQRIAL